MLNAPSFPLPRNVKTVEDAKNFIADKFHVPMEQVGQLGESYFTHTGVTPQRVYPFVVSSPPRVAGMPKWRYAPLKRMWRLFAFQRFSGVLLKMLARTQMASEADNTFSLNRSPVNLKNQGFSLATEKTAVEAKNVGYSAVPSRVLGQRGGAGGGGAAPAKTEEYQPYQPPSEAQTAVGQVLPQQPAATLPATNLSVGPPAKIDPAVLEQSKAAQAIIESIVSPRIGKRLMDSYAQAKKLFKGGDEIHMKETPTVAQIDKDIVAVADQLKKMRNDRLTLDLQPPKDKGGRM